jgi:hypothetical protein
MFKKNTKYIMEKGTKLIRSRSVAFTYRSEKRMIIKYEQIKETRKTNSKQYM